MKKLLALLLLFIGIQTFSQKQANIWYFGQGAGVDFNFSPPRALTDGQLYTLEGCSTFSNPDGELLFYSDGTTVYDKSHNIMNYTNGNPGNNLLGNSSAAQSGMIIPKPLNNDTNSGILVISTLMAMRHPMIDPINIAIPINT